VSQTGSVRVETEVWRASADEPIEAGARVRVVSVSGTRMRVIRIDE
jgi:membrane-bound ClpP family serine protease